MNTIRIAGPTPILIDLQTRVPGELLEIGKDIDEKTAERLIRRRRAVLVTGPIDVPEEPTDEPEAPKAKKKTTSRRSGRAKADQ